MAEQLHPHWVTLVPATLWFLVICAAGGVAIAFLPSGATIHLVLLIAVIVVGLLLLSWLSFSKWISWRTTHYVFTSHRVLIRRGVLHHVGHDIALQRNQRRRLLADALGSDRRRRHPDDRVGR